MFTAIKKILFLPATTYFHQRKYKKNYPEVLICFKKYPQLLWLHSPKFAIHKSLKIIKLLNSLKSLNMQAKMDKFEFTTKYN